MILEMLGEPRDLLGEDSDLHRRGAGIARVRGELGNDLLLGLRVQHSIPFPDENPQKRWNRSNNRRIRPTY